MVGGMLAEFLDCPSVSSVSGVNLEGGQLRINREIDGGQEVLETAPPFIAVVQKGIAKEPRIPSMRGIMMAKKKPIDEMDLAGLGTSPDEIGAGAAKSEIVEFMKSESRQAGQKFEGDAAEITAEFVKLLGNEAKVL